MDITFFYLVFQANPDKGRVTYWKDGINKKEVITKDKFLQLAMSVGSSVYSKIHGACNTYSFYLWDNVDGNIIHLTQKIEQDQQKIYKDSLIKEVYKVIENPQYDTQERLKKEKENKMKKGDPFSFLESMGFEKPSFDMISNLSNSMNNQPKGLFSNLKSLFNI